MYGYSEHQYESSRETRDSWKFGSVSLRVKHKGRVGIADHFNCTNEINMTNTREVELKALLERYTVSNTSSKAPSSHDVKLLAESLAPGPPRAEHALAYLTLSKIISTQAQSGSTYNELQSSGIEYIIEVFGSSTTDLDPLAFVPFTALIGSLFPLDPQSAQSLSTHQISVTSDKNAVDDPLAVLLEAAELPSALQPVLADMLAQAAGTKVGRELIRSRAEEWLRGAVGLNGSPDLAAVCAVALSKLNEEVVPGQEGQQEGDIMEMCDKMMEAVRSGSSTSAATRTSLEGLAVLSSRLAIRQRLADDSAFLKSLVSLSPIPRPKGGSLPITPRASIDLDLEAEPADTALCYGITTILVSITSPKATLSAEDTQAARLRAMAISGKRDTSQVAQDDPLESEDAVRKRVTSVIQSGGIKALTGLVRADSQVVKAGLGKLCLNMVEDRENRLVFIRDGGFKALSTVIRDLLPSSTKSEQAPVNETKVSSLLHAAQAMAKLVITTPPNLLFPPPLTTTCLNALTPLYHLLCGSSSSLLQRFESLMALTNIASIEPSIATRLVEATFIPTEREGESMWRGKTDRTPTRIFHRIEECLTNDNTLVRRAATELICNLVSCEAGFQEYSNPKNARVPSRLRLMLILTGSDDLPTRLAAGGVLATVTESPDACSSLLKEEDRPAWSRVLAFMEYVEEEEDEDGNAIPVISSLPPDEPSIHRGAIILFNLIEYVAAFDQTPRRKELDRMRTAGVQECLMRILRSKLDMSILEPVVATLKLLKSIE